METISDKEFRVGIIGLGTIGRAALEQWQTAGYDVVGLGRNDDLNMLADVDVITLAYKPQSFDDAGSDLERHITDRHIVLSFMAGKTACELSEVLGTPRVVRTMPNLNLLQSQSMTA